MHQIIALFIVTLSVLHAQNHPKMYESLGNKLFEAKEKLAPLGAMPGLVEAISHYQRQSDAVLEQGRKLEASGAVDAAENGNYLRLLRSLNGEYEGVVYQVRKVLEASIANDDYATFAAICSSAPEGLLNSQTVENESIAYYETHKASGEIESLDRLIERRDMEAKYRQRETSAPKELPPETRKLAEALTEVILQDRGDSELDCKKSVENAKNGIETLLEVGTRNYRAGYMAKEEYDKVTPGLRAMLKKISISECRHATGNVKGFYECMSNDYNHVATCGKKYHYGE